MPRIAGGPRDDSRRVRLSRARNGGRGVQAPRRARRGRQGPGRRPEPDPADEAPPGQPQAPRRHQRHPRASRASARKAARSGSAGSRGSRTSRSPSSSGAGTRSCSTRRKVIADPVVRNLATVGGNLAHGDPANDHPATMLALGAEVVASGTRGERRIPIGSFFTGPFATALKPDELLVEIRVPSPPARSGGAYLKLERKVGDFATAGGGGADRARRRRRVSARRDRAHQRRLHADPGVGGGGSREGHARRRRRDQAGRRSRRPGRPAFRRPPRARSSTSATWSGSSLRARSGSPSSAPAPTERAEP